MSEKFQTIEELQEELKIVGEILTMYQRVINSIHAVSSPEVRKVMEGLVTD